MEYAYISGNFKITGARSACPSSRKHGTIFRLRTLLSHLTVEYGESDVCIDRVPNLRSTSQNDPRLQRQNEPSVWRGTYRRKRGHQHINRSSTITSAILCIFCVHLHPVFPLSSGSLAILFPRRHIPSAQLDFTSQHTTQLDR
jgi:hypothetical protein